MDTYLNVRTGEREDYAAARKHPEDISGLEHDMFVQRMKMEQKKLQPDKPAPAKKPVEWYEL